MCVNELINHEYHSMGIRSPLTILLSPFAPQLAEELWQQLGNKSTLVNTPFPKGNESYLIKDSKNYPVSFNGKMRFTINLSLNLDQDAIKKVILKDLRTTEYLRGKTPKKWIIVPNKIINIVF